jgi:hypothetical protein
LSNKSISFILALMVNYLYKHHTQSTNNSQYDLKSYNFHTLMLSVSFKLVCFAYDLFYLEQKCLVLLVFWKKKCTAPFAKYKFFKIRLTHSHLHSFLSDNMAFAENTEYILKKVKLACNETTNVCIDGQFKRLPPCARTKI